MSFQTRTHIQEDNLSQVHRTVFKEETQGYGAADDDLMNPEDAK